MPRSRITGFFFVLCINYVNLPKDSDACKEIVSEKGQMEPYHSYHWRCEEYRVLFLVIDSQVRYEVEVEDIVFSLLSTFLFSICYHFFSFLKSFS